MKTDTELRIEGIQALVDAMGLVEAERFISLLLREPFDCTEWQKTSWPDKSVEELSAAAMELRRSEANGNTGSGA